MTRYFNYKNSNYHQEILQKTTQKLLGGIHQGLNPGPSDCGTCMLQKSYPDLLEKEGFFMVVKNVPCAQKIFVLLTSHS